MATTSNKVPRPGRTLAFFAAVIIALYAIVVLTSLGDADRWKPRLGLDLQGGTRITLQATSNGGNPDAGKLRQAADIIDQRVNGSGVTEAEVTTQGGNQIITEIPGKKEQRLVDVVTRTAQLRFRLVWGGPTAAPSTDPTAVKKSAADAKAAVAKVDWTKLTLDQMIKAETQGVSTLPAAYQPAIKALQTATNNFACTKDVGGTVEDDPRTPLVSCDPNTPETLLMSPAVIEGTDLKSAQAVVPQGQISWVVATTLKGDGKAAFSTITDSLFKASATDQQKSRFAIVLDGEVISAPTTGGHFTDGKSQIEGNFTATSAKALETQLKYGALPLKFKVAGTSVEGPSLAGAQLQAGLVAGLIGLLLVVVYSLLYYRGLGLVVVASLLTAGAITYALVLLLGKGSGFALTLPGIAGLIVAIGITADSFIVFFERLRDEVRDGKSLRLSVETGWKRARSTILAADAVSFLAALILYIFAIGVVRGFAFALGLTTLIDVFVVFFFTKPLVTLLARTKFFGRGHKLSGFDADHLGITGRDVSQFAKGPSAPSRVPPEKSTVGEPR